jgi:thymidylate kinase
MKRKLGIIVEGGDCSGKTTLVNRLRSKLSPQGWYSLSLSHRATYQFERYLAKYLSDERIIYDRAHFSEIVYGKLWRAHTGFTTWQQQFLHDFVLDNFVVVLVQAPRDTLMQRYRTRHQTQAIDISELEKAQDIFQEEMRDRNIIQYHAIDLESLDQVVNQVMAILEVADDDTTILKQPQQPQCVRDFILIEGANGSGKSTLDKLLKINMVGWSAKTLDYKSTDYFMRYLQSYLLHPETIFDRGHISEVVYANLFRNGHSFSTQELHLLNEYTARKSTILFCNPPLTVINERVSNASYPKHIREDALENVVNAFRIFLDVHHLNYWEVDTSDVRSVDNTIQYIRASYQTLTYHDMNWD